MIIIGGRCQMNPLYIFLWLFYNVLYIYIMFKMRRFHFRHARWFCSHESIMDHQNQNRIPCWKIMPMAGQNTNLRFMAEPLTQKDPTAGSEICVIYWFFASFHAPQLHSSDARWRRSTKTGRNFAVQVIQRRGSIASPSQMYKRATLELFQRPRMRACSINPWVCIS